MSESKEINYCGKTLIIDNIIDLNDRVIAENIRNNSSWNSGIKIGVLGDAFLEHISSERDMKAIEIEKGDNGIIIGAFNELGYSGLLPSEYLDYQVAYNDLIGLEEGSIDWVEVWEEYIRAKREFQLWIWDKQKGRTIISSSLQYGVSEDESEPLVWVDEKPSEYDGELWERWKYINAKGESIYSAGFKVEGESNEGGGGGGEEGGSPESLYIWANPNGYYIGSSNLQEVMITYNAVGSDESVEFSIVGDSSGLSLVDLGGKWRLSINAGFSRDRIEVRGVYGDDVSSQVTNSIVLIGLSVDSAITDSTIDSICVWGIGMAFLDESGLTRVWGKISSLFERKADHDSDIGDINTALNGKINVNHSNDSAPYIVCIKKRSNYNGGDGVILWSNGLMVQYNWDSSNSGTSVTRTWRFPFKSSDYSCVVTPAGGNNHSGIYSNLEVALSGASPYTYGKSATGYRLSNNSNAMGYNVIAIGECNSETLATYLETPEYDF